MKRQKTAFSPGRAGFPAWRSSRALAEAVEAYFDGRSADRLPPTCTGLCLYLGISLHTLRVCVGAERDAGVLAALTPLQRGEVQEILCYANLRIQSYAEEQLYLKGSWHAGEKLCAGAEGVFSPLKESAETDVRFVLPEALAPYTV